MESRGPEDSKNVKTSQAYFFEGFISFFEDFSLTNWYVHFIVYCSLLSPGLISIKLQPAIFPLSQHVIRFHELPTDTTQRFLQ